MLVTTTGHELGLHQCSGNCKMTGWPQGQLTQDKSTKLTGL